MPVSGGSFLGQLSLFFRPSHLLMQLPATLAIIERKKLNIKSKLYTPFLLCSVGRQRNQYTLFTNKLLPKFTKGIYKFCLLFFHFHDIINKLTDTSTSHRGVAQFGRALRSGRRGRKFESCRLDFTACWSSGQDDALSRRKPGFDSRTGHLQKPII